jgi:acetyl esterase/lipase
MTAANFMRLLMLACLTAWCSGCAQVAFFAANVPAAFGHYSRLTNLAYDTQSRNKLDVYIPQHLNTLQRPAPIVVFFHGGGWNSGDKSYYKFVGAALAEQGYIAVLPNYRLYPRVKSTAIFQDAAAAVAFVRAHSAEWGGSETQLYLVGHSAGAHLAVMLALNPEYLRQVGMSPQQLRGVVGLAGPYSQSITYVPMRHRYCCCRG